MTGVRYLKIIVCLPPILHVKSKEEHKLRYRKAIGSLNELLDITLS
jgi:hypothetical protein